MRLLYHKRKHKKVDFFPANSSIQILFQMKTETNLVAAGVHRFKKKKSGHADIALVNFD